MKVGILTFHDTTNFGSLLQTYALYKVLRDNNIDCDVIDYQCAEIRKRELKYENISSWTFKNVIKYILFSEQSKKKHKEFIKFLRKNISLSVRYNRDDIARANDCYDCFIVGSDIVWGLDVTGNDETYFLDFTQENKLKMSYASSANQIEGTDYTERIIELLRRFDLISVREERVKGELLSHLSNREIKLVCDPTMLIEPQYWKALANLSDYNKKLPKKNYVLMYFPDGEGKMLNDAKMLKKKYNYEVYCINDKLPLHGVKNIHIYKIEDFLCFILNAKLILSGSYHGTLFSLYFQKEFYYYVRAHGERMNTISKILKIEDRQAKFIAISRAVDYLYVGNKIHEYRVRSYEYVNEMIGMIEKYEKSSNDM